jgi:CRP-like cAMP-binding protein
LRFYSNIQFLENLRLPSAYSKTAHQLAFFASRFGEQRPNGIRLTLPLTHQDIADIIGTTRETVSASIIKLREKKLIKTDRYILIFDLDALVKEAYML